GEIDAFELPVFVTVKLCDAVLPSFTLPKLRFCGLMLRVVVAATPVPLSATVAGEFGALLTIETAPVAAPAVCGAYCALKLAAWPGVRVIGKVSPLRLNPVPVTVACEIVKLAVPLFFS